MMPRRTIAMLVVLSVLLLLTAAWSYRQFADARADAVAAQSAAARCEATAKRIERIADGPTQASDHVRLANEINEMIETAVVAGKAPRSCIKHIGDEPARRIEGTPYKEQPTSVLLRNVTRPQVAAALHTLLASGSGLHAKSLRLTALQPNDTSDHWNADLVLTYLLYDPPAPKTHK